MFEMEYDKQMDINFDVCWMEMYMNVYNEIPFGYGVFFLSQKTVFRCRTEKKGS